MKTSFSPNALDPQVVVLKDLPVSELSPRPNAEPAREKLPERPPRPAWIEINLQQLRRNFELINRDKPEGLRLLSVLKDEAYGHGAFQVAMTALDCGAGFLALSTLEEAILLRERGIRSRILLIGDREERELHWCLRHNLTCSVSEPRSVALLSRLAAAGGERVPVHLKINTGMNRYGVRWNEAASLAALISSEQSLFLEGVFSHFAQSDETDKSFAMLQRARFEEALGQIQERGIPVRIRHLCNSGGFLDLPSAYFDMVRVGILPLGVYPSSVCRRIPGIEPVMTVKARIAAVQRLLPGETVGYGMRYAAPAPRRIGVLPIGYGDGYPRVRNQGFALVHGQRVPVVGGVAMDALTIDITNVPQAQLWSEAILMGRQGQEEISVQEVAKLKNTVAYDVLTGWRRRLPRIYLNSGADS